MPRSPAAAWPWKTVTFSPRVIWLHGLVELGQVGVAGAAVDVVELGPGDLELRAQLHEREHLAPRRADALGRAGYRVDPPQVGGRVVPAVRADEVDQLAGGQVGGEPRLGLVVDGVPAGVGDRGQIAVEMVHRTASFQAADAERARLVGGGLLGLAAPTSVSGPDVNRNLRSWASRAVSRRRSHSRAMAACSFSSSRL